MKFTKKVAALALAFAATTFSVNAATGIVATDKLNIRSGASADSAVVGMAYTGSAFNVKEYLNGWYRIDYNGMDAFVSSDYVSISVLAQGCVTYTEGDIFLRSTPAWDNGGVFEKVSYGDLLSVTGIDGDFYEILYHGNIRYIPVICTDVRREAVADRQLTIGTLGQRAVEISANYLGVPYVYGGSSPYGFDCSGFTGYVYAQLGVSLPRSSAAQAGAGVAVDKSQLIPGDLVFFNTSGRGVSHVGMYVGNGSFIHAPLPGSYVSYANLNSPYWSRTYVCARRVVR